MLIYDELYGKYEVEAVLSALIESPEVQRLKDVHMAGAAYLVNPLWNETRYEHSIGVMLLIRCLGGSLEEQIAGLLHDISHTAFSHLIDQVLGNDKEDFHEEIKGKWLQDSSIPTILSSFGYDYQQLLLDDSKWSILEQSAPDLCADRIDYTLRESHRYFAVPLAEIHGFIDSICINKGKMVLNDVYWGGWFVKQYRKIVIDFFYDPLNIYSHDLVGQMLSFALEQGAVCMDDLMATDGFLWQKIKAVETEEIQNLFTQLVQPTVFERVDEKASYDVFQQKKVRYVDPLIHQKSGAVRVSDLSVTAAEQINQMVTDGRNGIYLKYHRK